MTRYWPNNILSNYILTAEHNTSYLPNTPQFTGCQGKQAHVLVSVNHLGTMHQYSLDGLNHLPELCVCSRHQQCQPPPIFQLSSSPPWPHWRDPRCSSQTPRTCSTLQGCPWARGCRQWGPSQRAPWCCCPRLSGRGSRGRPRWIRCWSWTYGVQGQISYNTKIRSDPKRDGH